MTTSSVPKILYVVDHSYPYSSDGYAVRTHAVAKGLQQCGFEVVVMSRFGRLWSRAGFEGVKVPAEQHVDGVRYLFIAEPSQAPGTPYEEWVPKAVRAYEIFLRVIMPDVVMAASNFENAQPIQKALKNLVADRTPFIYEVRGFWELTRATKDPKWATSDAYMKAKESEATVASSASKVLTLNSLMRDELLARGVSGAKIALLPNSLSAMPSVDTPGKHTLSSLGIQAKVVMGYIGSFNAYEGLSLLVEALSLLRKAGKDVALMLVGSDAQQGVDQKTTGLDPVQQKLFEQAQDLGVERSLHFTGRLPPDDVQSLYALLDIIVNPRLLTPVTKIVSSLKSIEALAHGMPLVLSDIPPHQEIASQAPGVWSFSAGQADALAATLMEVIGQLHSYNGVPSRSWVAGNRLYPVLLRDVFKHQLDAMPLPTRIAMYQGNSATESSLANQLAVNPPPNIPIPALDEFEALLQHYPDQAYQTDVKQLLASYAFVVGKEGKGKEHERAYQLLLDRREKGLPFSVVRMNDGEGSVAFADQFQQFSALREYVVGRISKIIFGDSRVVLNAQTEFIGLLDTSIENADIVGIPDATFVTRHVARKLQANEAHTIDVRAVSGCMAQVQRLVHKPGLLSQAGLVCGPWVSKGLQPYYKQICHWFQHVYIITGHQGLAAKVSVAFAHPSVHDILVPAQRALLSDPKAHHYPQRFNSVLREIEQLPDDSLVLVGAGLLGKYYCRYAKTHGHSAIDIGHVADLWLGLATRPNMTEDKAQRWAL